MSIILFWAENQSSFLNLSSCTAFDEATVKATNLRDHRDYIAYYLVLSNIVFMGIGPMIVMTVLNVHVVRAVEKANKRRAKMTTRQQRNNTVTSVLVSVVLVFIICHSAKLIINIYEVTSKRRRCGYLPSTFRYIINLSPSMRKI